MNKKGINLAEILDNIGIPALNEMQQAAIAAAEHKNNVVLLSATGSGKTLGFLLPVLSKLDPDLKGTQALIIAPSRELSQQIDQVFRSMRTGYKITCCYGGHLRETEENNLVQAPAVIVGTPGRLADHIRRENITVDTIQMLVLDEFDKSLELGFHDEMEFIISSLPGITRRMLTSATKAVEIPEFVGMEGEERVNFLVDEPEDENKLTLKKVESPSRDKIDTLFRLICMFGNRSAIVFCNHREAVERTSQLLHEKGVVNEFYHGAMEQQQRDSALCKFRNGTVNVLVTTDLAARGLDIPNIRYIVHYHIPHTEDSFIHRNGRTARMDATGTAIVIAGPDEEMPPFIPADTEIMTLPETTELPEKPKWTTLFISAGKKDKVNKVDIVGFLAQKGGLKKDDIGLIEVRDFFAFAAIRKSRASATLGAIKDQKLKNKKVRIEVAK